MINKDIVKIEGIKEISNERLMSLVFLYKELMSEKTVNIYLAMIYLNHDNFYAAKELFNIIDISAIKLEDVMHDLERYGLIKTYYKVGEYIIDVIPPLNCNEFFANAIFDRLLAYKTKKRYDALKRLLIRTSDSKDGYKDISAKMDIDMLDEKKDDHDRSLNDIKNKYVFPIEELVKHTSTIVFPEELRNYDNLTYISKLGEIYNVSVDDMRKFLNRTIVDGEIKMIDRNKLEELCVKNKKHTDHGGDEYDISPNTFLRKLRGVKSLTTDDRMIIRNLASEDKYDLEPSVINVLLEYVYRRFGSNLNRSMIYAIANEWHYKNIDDADKAKNALASFKDNEKSKAKKEDIIPVYDDTKNPKMSKEDMLYYHKYVLGEEDE